MVLLYRRGSNEYRKYAKIMKCYGGCRLTYLKENNIQLIIKKFVLRGKLRLIFRFFPLSFTQFFLIKKGNDFVFFVDKILSL